MGYFVPPESDFHNFFWKKANLGLRGGKILKNHPPKYDKLAFLNDHNFYQFKLENYQLNPICKLLQS